MNDDLPELSSDMVNSDSSNPHPTDHHRSAAQFKPFYTPIASRIARAFYRLRLLHRSAAAFSVLGASGNVYTVTLSTVPSCTCPDQIVPCKHILFVYLRVLGVSLDAPILHRITLTTEELTHLLRTPTSPDSLAGDTVRERYQKLASRSQSAARDSSSSVALVEEGATCPICLEEMRKEDRVVVCGACRNGLHDQCLKTWRKSRGRRGATCVICRERWREVVEQDGYLNLAAYVSEEDNEDNGDEGNDDDGNEDVDNDGDNNDNDDDYEMEEQEEEDDDDDDEYEDEEET